MTIDLLDYTFTMLIQNIPIQSTVLSHHRAFKISPNVMAFRPLRAFYPTEGDVGIHHVLPAPVLALVRDLTRIERPLRLITVNVVVNSPQPLQLSLVVLLVDLSLRPTIRIQHDHA